MVPTPSPAGITAFHNGCTQTFDFGGLAPPQVIKRMGWTDALNQPWSGMGTEAVKYYKDHPERIIHGDETMIQAKRAAGIAPIGCGNAHYAASNSGANMTAIVFGTMDGKFPFPTFVIIEGAYTTVKSDEEVKNLDVEIIGRKDGYFITDVEFEQMLPALAAKMPGKRMQFSAPRVEKGVLIRRARVGGISPTNRAMLVMDGHDSRTTPEVAAKLSQLGIDLLLLPGGLTAYIQIMDWLFGPIKNAWHRNSHHANLRYAQMGTVGASVAPNSHPAGPGGQNLRGNKTLNGTKMGRISARLQVMRIRIFHESIREVVNNLGETRVRQQIGEMGIYPPSLEKSLAYLKNKCGKKQPTAVALVEGADTTKLPKSADAVTGYANLRRKLDSIYAAGPEAEEADAVGGARPTKSKKIVYNRCHFMAAQDMVADRARVATEVELGVRKPAKPTRARAKAAAQAAQPAARGQPPAPPQPAPQSLPEIARVLRESVAAALAARPAAPGRVGGPQASAAAAGPSRGAAGQASAAGAKSAMPPPPPRPQPAQPPRGPAATPARAPARQQHLPSPQATPGQQSVGAASQAQGTPRPGPQPPQPGASTPLGSGAAAGAPGGAQRTSSASGQPSTPMPSAPALVAWADFLANATPEMRQQMAVMLAQSGGAAAPAQT